MTPEQLAYCKMLAGKFMDFRPDSERQFQVSMHLAAKPLHVLAVAFGPDLAIRALRELLENFEKSRPVLLGMAEAVRLEVEVLDGLQGLPVRDKVGS